MRGFGSLESEIMERLWSWNRPATVREIVDDLNRSRQVAYTTVTTVADILHRKGLLDRHKEGRAWVYRPVRSRDEHAADVMHGVLAESPDPRTALLLFVEQMDDGQARALRDLLDNPTGDR